MSSSCTSGICQNPVQPVDFGPTPIMRTTADTLPVWAIIVIAFGILLILLLIATIVCCLCRLGCWCCAADSDDDCKRKKQPRHWYGRRKLSTGACAAGSKRPQILYRYPDNDDGCADNCAASACGSSYVPRAQRCMTGEKHKTVRVVEDVNFDDDGRPVYVVEGGRSSVIGANSSLSNSRMSTSRPKLVNEYMLRGSSVEDVRSDLVYGSHPHATNALITIDGHGISSYGGDAMYSGYNGGQGAGHSAAIHVAGGGGGGHAHPF